MDMLQTVNEQCEIRKKNSTYRPYAYDVTPSKKQKCATAWGSIGLRVKAVVRNVPVADLKHVQGIGFDPQHGGTMTSMHKVY